MSTLCEADKSSMANAQPRLSKPFILDTRGLDHLIRTLLDQGYQVLGPTVSDGAIVYQPVSSVDDLPAGWTDQQQGGRYRLHRRSDGVFFGHVVGPHSWKKFLYPPARRLWRVQRKASQAFRRLPKRYGHQSDTRTRVSRVGKLA